MSQTEGVVNNASPGSLRDQRVVSHQLVGNQIPVVSVVVDSVVCTVVVIDDDPLAWRGRIGRLYGRFSWTEPQKLVRCCLRLRRIFASRQRKRYPPQRRAGQNALAYRRV